MRQRQPSTCIWQAVKQRACSVRCLKTWQTWKEDVLSVARLEPSTMSHWTPETLAADTSRGTIAACTGSKAAAGQAHMHRSAAWTAGKGLETSAVRTGHLVTLTLWAAKHRCAQIKAHEHASTGFCVPSLPLQRHVRAHGGRAMHLHVGVGCQGLRAPAGLGGAQLHSADQLLRPAQGGVIGRRHLHHLCGGRGALHRSRPSWRC